MEHTPVTELTTWGEMMGMNYMKFTVQGIGIGGGISVQEEVIELKQFLTRCFGRNFLMA